MIKIDIQGKENYAADLEAKSFQNDLYNIVNSKKISDSGLLNGFLYINIGNTREYSIIKLVLAITNHKKKSNNKNTNLPILIYKNSRSIISLND